MVMLHEQVGKQSPSVPELFDHDDTYCQLSCMLQGAWYYLKPELNSLNTHLTLPLHPLIYECTSVYQ